MPVSRHLLQGAFSVIPRRLPTRVSGKSYTLLVLAWSLGELNPDYRLAKAKSYR